MTSPSAGSTTCESSRSCRSTRGEASDLHRRPTRSATRGLRWSVGVPGAAPAYSTFCIAERLLELLTAITSGTGQDGDDVDEHVAADDDDVAAVDDHYENSRTCCAG